VNVKRSIASAGAVLAVLLVVSVAVVGQFRVIDLPSGVSDPDDVTFSSDDAVFMIGQSLVLSPPDPGARALPLPVTRGLGRTVIAELFRPPT
jgi:hypothetical protein